MKVTEQLVWWASRPSRQ